MDSIRGLLFEDPFYVYVGLGLVAVALAGAWYSRRRAKWLLLLAVVAALAAGVFFLERAVVTDREQIWSALDEIALAVNAGDIDAAGVWLDEKFTGWGIGRARLGKQATLLAIKAYATLQGIREVQYLGARPVTFTGEDYATGTVRTVILYGKADKPGRALLAWKLEWIKRPEGWRIRRAERSDDDVPVP